jgi:hemolysin D
VLLDSEHNFFDSKPGGLTKNPSLILKICSVFLVIALFWIYFAQLDIVAVAEGKIIPQHSTKTVQAAETGIVETILVKDGDHVKAGQTLIRLNPKLNEIDLDGSNVELALKELTLHKLSDELKGTISPITKGYAESLTRQVDSQFTARKLAYLNTLAQESAAIDKARSELRASERLLEKLTGSLAILQKASDSYQKLKVEGYVGEVLANEKFRELIERERDVKTQEASIQGLTAALSQAELKLVSAKSTHRAQLENERTETLGQLNRTKSDNLRLKIRNSRLEVVAPADGIVKDISVSSVGAVVPAGNVLLIIVPTTERMIAEVAIRNEDIGFITKDMPVRLKVAAFPFQKYGLIEGKVMLLSADANDMRASQQGATQNFNYRVLISLNDEKVVSKSTGDPLMISAGMQVSAEIHLGKRTVFEYLLSPLTKVVQESGRER